MDQGTSIMKGVHLVTQEGADALFEWLRARDKLHDAQAAADWHHIVRAHLQDHRPDTQ